ncbi:hypothetical protein V6N13_045627 [Hibiscus sabdariffa]
MPAIKPNIKSINAIYNGIDFVPLLAGVENPKMGCGSIDNVGLPLPLATVSTTTDEDRKHFVAAKHSG